MLARICIQRPVAMADMLGAMNDALAPVDAGNAM
jgi:hypothetical protein